jgi:hypothetical protein
MALGSSNITLSSVISEWGQYSNGTAAGVTSSPPKNLSVFYRGGSYVPDNYYTTGGISSTVNGLKGSQFFSTNAEADGATILNAYINSGHITRYFGINTGRYYSGGAPGTTSWVGYDSSGKPAVPYRWNDIGSTPINVTSYYYNSDLTGYSKWTSSVYLSQGRANNVSSTFGGNNLAFNPGNGSSLWIDRYSTIARDVYNSASFSWQRGYDYNSFGTGSWGRIVTIPGKWDLNQYANLASTDYNQIAANGDLYYRINLAPGEWSLIFSQDVGYRDGPSAQYYITTAPTVRCDDWWYNTAYSLWSFNNSYGYQYIDLLTATSATDEKYGYSYYNYSRPANHVFGKWQRSY